MTHKTVFGCVGAICVTAIIVAATARQGGQEMSPEQMKMMEAWMEYSTPGEPHQQLADRAGTYNVTVEMRMAPDAPAETSYGKATSKMIMGGRYLLEKFEGEFEGQPFEGMGLVGYDNMKKKLVSTWIDNMSTGVMYFEGTQKGDKLEMTGMCPDFMTGQMKQCRSVEKKVDDDTFVVEMFDKSPEGKEFVAMTLTYKRAD